MYGNRNHRVVVGIAFLMSVGGISSAASWRLSESGQWSDIAQDPQSKMLLDISAFKQQIAAGQSAEAARTLASLRAENPRLDGPDMVRFIEAEKLYATRNWDKAVRKYDELLDQFPTSWLCDAALERQYSIGVAYLNGEKRKVLFLRLSGVEDGAAIMQKISDRTGDAPIAKRSLVTLARSYEKQKMYMEAYETWVEVSSRWPTGDLGREALLEMGQNLHSSYKGPLYDHKGLTSAKSYYANYALRYPEDAKDRDMAGKQNLIEEQLAYKQYSIGRYYDRTDDPSAAEMYYNEVIQDWSASSAAQRAQARLDQKTDGKLPEEPKKLNRKMFDGMCTFLDHWFGLTWIIPTKTANENSGDLP